MRINILLPAFTRRPIGGFLVQYEYANRLASLGFDVAIYHSLNEPSLVPKSLRSTGGLIRHNVKGRSEITWHSIAPKVKCRYLPQLRPHLLRKADVTILTSFDTAEAISSASRRTGRLFQIVYDYEFWLFASGILKQRMRLALLRSDVSHIATSGAVQRMLAEIGVKPTATIACGTEIFSANELPPAASRRLIVGFPWRREPYKGTNDMLAAVELLKHLSPEVSFECFGASMDAEDLQLIKFHGALSKHELQDFYRSCAIFVLPSHAEGWGLPAMEAMANGAAVIVTDNGGSNDFAIHEQTALVVPIQDPQSIAISIARLLGDLPLREKLIRNALNFVGDMTWDKSVKKLVELIEAS